MTIAEIARIKPRQKTLCHLDYIVEEVEYARRHHGELVDHRQYTACLGVCWAMNSGRLPAEAVRAIRNMTAYRLCGLLDQVAAECEVMADVPRWLIRRFCGGEATT